MSPATALTKEPTEAANWLRKAAEQGNSDAQFQLGYLYDSLFKNIYLNGQTDNGGLPFDDAEAFKWYLKAAKQGNISAQFYLGAKYSLGRGVLEDDIEALAWLNIAAAARKHTGRGNQVQLGEEIRKRCGYSWAEKEQRNTRRN